ncbi:(E)-2-epi-beta-caryophyllene synthase [Lasiodiplodia theobromae]|uniref:Terpene synthase n=1 Tax=Lasiodiplodia theobromae TaxID=45133 RepID=A0A5N5DDU1_9PEZI|nr:(E)-2-epi-beta-caryophyllene synthase [Lasiodiplodia theobromae]
MAAMTFDPRELVLQQLRRSTFVIPDLKGCFRDWPVECSPHLDQIRKDVHAWLEETLGEGRALQISKRADFGLFGATEWPYASYERCRIACLFCAWVFTWDDEIDSSLGSMGDDLESAQTYRFETIQFVKETLGLAPRSATPPSNKIIRNFEVVGDALREAYTVEQRQRFFAEVDRFMRGTEDEQRRRLLSRDLPTLEQFWKYRLGSSAVNICTSLIEYGFGDMALPAAIWEDEDMKTIERNTNIHLSGLNDLYSIKKEVAINAVESLIPILLANKLVPDLPEAVDHVAQYVADRSAEMDECAERLLQRYPQHAYDLRRFVDNCRCMCTGNRTWSLSTGRYGITKRDINEDGTIFMDLAELCIKGEPERRPDSPEEMC